MLILRRKSGESIVISDNITLTVLDINEGSVRLAIDAPKTIPILRSELLQAADANRDSAAGDSAPSGLFRLLEGKRDAARPVRPGALRTGAGGRVHAPAQRPASGATPSATSGAPASGATPSTTSDATPQRPTPDDTPS